MLFGGCALDHNDWHDMCHGAAIALLTCWRVAVQCRYVWFFGTDGGVFDGVRVEAYGKDFPIDRLEEDVLLAVAMNGESLRPENGFPVRLVVPGFYGTNSVKWLNRMTLAATRAEVGRVRSRRSPV